MSIQKQIKLIKSSKIFQNIVTIVIIFSSILVGASTYNVDGAFIVIINILDYAITIFFIIEILIRFFSESKKQDFFKDGWNIFDTVIVLSSIIPTGAGNSIIVLRLLRLARLLRIISFLPELRFVIESLIESIKQSISILILTFILIYIYAVAGVILFGDIANGRFETLGQALLALFQIMTLSSWENIMLPIVGIYPYSWIFFVSYVFLSSLIILNLFIAILVDVVAERKKRQTKEVTINEQRNS